MIRIDALKQFFSVPGKPVTNAEVMELRKASAEDYERLADECIEALEREETAVAA